MIVIIARWSSLKGNYNLSAVYEPILSSFTGKDWIYILNPSLLLMMREMLYIWCLKVAAGQLEAARFLLTICSRCWNQNHCRYPCFVSHNITGAGAEPGTLVWERLPLVGWWWWGSSSWCWCWFVIVMVYITGRSVRGEKEREHYRSVMVSPRLVIVIDIVFFVVVIIMNLL